ncbi:MAG: hypothetical protein JXR96_18660 [Deltaproteobacteria bacterium]|nr:hypothetical protein [Deltaproteobacteria bacterium]
MALRLNSIFLGGILLFCLTQSTLARAAEDADSQESEYRSPGLSLGLSLGSVLAVCAVGTGFIIGDLEGEGEFIGAIVIAAGFVLTPSIGHFYSGEWPRGLIMTGGRCLCFFLGFAGVAAGLEHKDDLGLTLMTLGGIGLGGLAIWDVVDSYDAAERANQAHAGSLVVGPLLLPPPPGEPEAGMAAGLQLAFAF